MVAGDHRFVFLPRGYLYLVAVACTTESEAMLQAQLEYLYAQIISILTAGIMRVFERQPSADVRHLLDGTLHVLHGLIDRMDHTPAFMLSSVECLRLPFSVRSDITKALLSNTKTLNIVYGVIACGFKVVSVVRPRKHTLHVQDLLLLLHFVNSSSGFKTGETWSPICLPNFNDKGFLYAYIHFLSPTVSIALLTADSKLFHEFSTCKNSIVRFLEESQYLDMVTSAVEEADFSAAHCNVPHLRHFIYKSLSPYNHGGVSNFISPVWDGVYSSSDSRNRAFRLYQNIHTRVHGEDNRLCRKLYFQTSQYEAVLAWTQDEFELYALFGPLVVKPSAISACNKLMRWIKREEHGLLLPLL
mmetsp:Transcript_53084/g.88245  ORF Transcript_53084/g.88245 Transcript_53084/m.88245 type:complete len:358 (+) Transcript_53084:445-1518(+)|eukprot:CAMPEP_0184651838 /NCGR_PEP_ID=MMETSP0308-20130426/9483_1 /TAXON_ID=38269 /ORGANISM="Gloeochaete witrockiana, Strain SAG 46.84" /LENGTH=357 /DNA_ID=CAMNT_0027086319 /DNA_START=83 /DNA_END=1156 /DNA_ORIENTATION=+